MSGQPPFNFLNMSNFNMLNPQNTQISQAYEKAIKDAANSVHLQKLGKKQLQQIAKELNIPEKKKKEEIIAQIPKQLLQYLIQVDPSRPVEQLLQHQPNLQNNESIMAILKKFQGSIINKTQSFQQQPQMQRAIPQLLQNSYLNYMVLPQAQQTQQQMLPQYSPLMNINLYQQHLRQNPPQQFFYQYNNQWNDPLPQTEMQQLLMCPCKIIPAKRITNEEVKCINCDNKLHISCLKLQPNDVKMFECPVCILSKIDPLNQIIKVLAKPTLMNTTQSTLNFMLTTEEYHQLQDRSFQYQVELRSIRLDAKYMNEITWPDFCEISINQQRISEFKPLKSNSSLKKRKDEIQIIPQQQNNLAFSLKSGYNQIIIKEVQNCQEPKTQFKLCEDGVYAQAIYLTKKRPHQDLINQIKQNKDCIKTKEECVKLIQKACIAEKTDNDVQIDKITIKVSLKCQFDYQMIQTPARGRFCTHVQCFSLENTITINAGTSRKWKCPVCKKKIFDIMIDSYQLQLLDQYRNNKENIKEVVFDQNGDIVQEIKEEFQESEEEQISINKQNQIEEQQKQPLQQKPDPTLLSRLMLFNPAATFMQIQLCKKQIDQINVLQQQQQQLSQQQIQQKEKNENVNSSQNKAQLKQFVESNLSNIEGKQNSLQSQLSQQTITKPKFIKFKKFETWQDEISQQEIAQKNLEKQINDQLNEEQNLEQKQSQQQQDEQQQQQQQQRQQQQQVSHQENDKPNQKSNRLKERMVRVIKKQFSEFIRKNFANNINATNEQNPKNPQQTQQQQLHQSATKKYIYKFSEEKPKINTSSQFPKMLADQIIMQNPGQTEKQHEDLKAFSEEQLKSLQAFQGSVFQQQLINSKQQDQNILIQKALSHQNPPIIAHQQQQLQQLQQQQQQQISQQKLKEKPIIKIKSPQPTSVQEGKNGKDMENPICID